METKNYNKISAATTTFTVILLTAAAVLASCIARKAVVERSVNIGVADHSPSVLIVAYDQEVGKQPLLRAIEAIGAEIVYDYSFISGMAIKKPSNKTLDETMNYFRSVEGVLSVEYDHIYHLDSPVKPCIMQ